MSSVRQGMLADGWKAELEHRVRQPYIDHPLRRGPHPNPHRQAAGARRVSAKGLPGRALVKYTEGNLRNNVIGPRT